MDDCFWTDMVGCAEDCAPPPAQSAYMDCDYTNSNTAHVTIYPAADAVPFTGDVTVVSARSWRADQAADSTACDWKPYVINANGQAVDDAVPDNGVVESHTFKPESYFSGTGTLFTGDVGLVAADNMDGTRDMAIATLLLAMGFENDTDHTQSNYGGGTLVLVLTDGAGEHYIATGIYSSCF